MQAPTRKLKDIDRLLAGYPADGSVDAEQRLRNYLLAVDDYPADDVTAAVDALIKGVAPGVNPNFVPTPAAVGAECSRQNHLRCEREARERRMRPALPAPEVQKSPESRARVKALLEELANRLSTSDPDERWHRHRAQLRRSNERFDAERGFVVGDSEGDVA